MGVTVHVHAPLAFSENAITYFLAILHDEDDIWVYQAS